MLLGAVSIQNLLFLHLKLPDKSPNSPTMQQSLANEIIHRFLSLGNPREAEHLARFFKTGEGEYGFGDKFLGIRVPTTRSVVKEYKDIADIDTCVTLIQSEWHEIRLAGFLLLIELYRKAKKRKDMAASQYLVEIYINHIPYGNNWDLVDLVCQYLIGDWLVDNPRKRSLLDKFAAMNYSLWHQRVAIVSTLSMIREGQFSDTIRIAKKFLSHSHDLIHKASGWMLREMGKRGGYKELIAFLDEFSAKMPRTMLRYSIERLPEPLRKHYLKKPV